MDSDNLDGETQKVLHTGEELSRFVKGDVWNQILKPKLVDKMMDYQSVMNVMDASPEMLLVDIRSRRMIVEFVAALIKDIEGTAAQHEANQQKANTNEDIVLQF